MILMPKVRLELASTLGAYRTPIAHAALARLLIDGGDDLYMMAAVLSSLNPRNVSPVLTEVLQSPESIGTPGTLELIGQAVAMGDEKTIGHVVELVCSRQSGGPSTSKFESLALVLDGLQSREFSYAALPEATADRIARTIRQARSTAADELSAENIRAASIPLLGREDALEADDLKLLERLLVPRSPAVVQQAVVSHLARQGERSAGDVLLSGWRSHSPELRRQIADVLASRSFWSDSLLRHLESGTIHATELSTPVRQRLLEQGKDDPRWQQALTARVSSSRDEVLSQFQPALNLVGDPSRGDVLFRKLCITCHKLKDEGFELGPQLASITNKTKETLFASILDPNAAVDANYVNYSILTEDGRILTGKLETETGSSITLLSAAGNRETILRRDIERVQATGKSVMPEGLEQGLAPQDLADLIQFVRDTFR